MDVKIVFHTYFPVQKYTFLFTIYTIILWNLGSEKKYLRYSTELSIKMHDTLGWNSTSYYQQKRADWHVPGFGAMCNLLVPSNNWTLQHQHTQRHFIINQRKGNGVIRNYNCCLYNTIFYCYHSSTIVMKLALGGIENHAQVLEMDTWMTA